MAASARLDPRRTIGAATRCGKPAVDVAGGAERRGPRVLDVRLRRPSVRRAVRRRRPSSSASTGRETSTRTSTATIEAIPTEDASFDVVLCLQVLEHVSGSGGAQCASFAASCARRPGARVSSRPTHGVYPFHPNPRGPMAVDAPGSRAARSTDNGALVVGGGRGRRRDGGHASRCSSAHLADLLLQARSRPRARAPARPRAERRRRGARPRRAATREPIPAARGELPRRTVT